jgi:hypothetical protein
MDSSLAPSPEFFRSALSNLEFSPREREREKWQSSERHYIYLRKKERTYIFSLEGSQAVPARPSDRGSAFNWD